MKEKFHVEFQVGDNRRRHAFHVARKYYNAVGIRMPLPIACLETTLKSLRAIREKDSPINPKKGQHQRPVVVIIELVKSKAKAQVLCKLTREAKINANDLEVESQDLWLRDGRNLPHR